MPLPKRFEMQSAGANLQSWHADGNTKELPTHLAIICGEESADMILF